MGGMQDKEIEEHIAREREQMIQAVTEGSLKYESEIDKKDSHQLALEKERQMARFEKALRIDRNSHVDGQAFDQDMQAKLKIERMQQRAEQEQAKLIAAQKAEKAQKKAEKLREKAEKAKQKAEKKLQKLKEKQEKKRIKQEQKAEEEDKATRKAKERANRLETLEEAEQK